MEPGLWPGHYPQNQAEEDPSWCRTLSTVDGKSEQTGRTAGPGGISSAFLAQSAPLHSAHWPPSSVLLPPLHLCCPPLSPGLSHTTVACSDVSSFLLPAKSTWSYAKSRHMDHVWSRRPARGWRALCRDSSLRTALRGPSRAHSPGPLGGDRAWRQQLDGALMTHGDLPVQEANSIERWKAALATGCGIVLFPIST